MSEAVKNFLDKAGADYSIHIVDGPTMTAHDAATRLQVPLERIIKSIVFATQDDSPLVAIVTGDKRVDRGKLSAIAGAKVRIATADATKIFTGFEIGSMPPLGHRYPIATVIDRKVMSFNRVYGGAGTPDALIEIDSRDLAKLTDARVADICESTR